LNRSGRLIVYWGMTAETHTRRAVLLTGGAAVGTAALAACAGGAEPATGSTPPPAAPAGQRLAALSDVPVGGAASITTPEGKPAIVARPDDTAVVAFDAACTHKGCPVAPQGAELRCPCHGSLFDAFTGAVKSGPAQTPLPAITVKVDNGQIVTG
jgi:Rieske Fe-S protein